MIADRFPVPFDGPPVLGLGAFLKTTVSLIRDGEALVSADLGNLDSRDGIVAFEAAVDHLLAEAGPPPQAVGHDLHPDFPSTRRALALGFPPVGVQHHHAHVCAVMAEYGRTGPVLGLALDGFGLGDDGGSWGGELLRVDARGCRRLGHLRPLPLPGGDKAAREPWRMAAGVLHDLGRGAEIPARFADIPAAADLARLLDQGLGARRTSSAGRLFDAAAGLLGIKPVAAFEGEAPMALEALVDVPRVAADGWRLQNGVLDPLPLLARLADLDPAEGAALFHGTLVAALDAWVAEAVADTDIRCVAFGGGCFLNRILRDGLADALGARGLEVLVPERLSPGDPAVSLGQAWAVAMTRRR